MNDTGPACSIDCWVVSLKVDERERECVYACVYTAVRHEASDIFLTYGHSFYLEHNYLLRSPPLQNKQTWWFDLFNSLNKVLSH